MLSKLPEGIVLKEVMKELRPAQKKALENGLLEGENLLVCTPTASGKTFVAEIAIIKHLNENKGKAIYIVPLKALASEKYREFKKKYPEKKIALSIGEKDSKEARLDEDELIFLTAEKLDAILRHKPVWIANTSLIIIDEIHLINDPARGPTLEVLITLLKRIIPKAQYIALSATIGNPETLAGWLGANLVKDTWRPVELYEGLFDGTTIEFAKKSKNTLISERAGDDTVSLAVDTIKKKKQALIFVKTKREAESLAEKVARAIKNEPDIQLAEKLRKAIAHPTKQCERLAKVARSGVVFHHSGLLEKQRSLIEEKFRDGSIKIICCTPTLAAGVDLPAFRVIIKDLKRYAQGWGLQWIQTLEQKQMAGRAGRPGMEDYGEAIMLAKTNAEKEEIVHRYINGEIEPIQSKLASEVALRIHSLSLLTIQAAKSKEELLDFFKETFFGYTAGEKKYLREIIEKVLYQLEEFELIIQTEKIKVTRLGQRVAELYIDPISAHHLVKCIVNAKKKNFIDFSVLHAISNTVEMAPTTIPAKGLRQIEEDALQYEAYLLQEVPDQFELDYEVYLYSIKLALILKDWIEEVDEDNILDKYGMRPGELRVKIETGRWLCYATNELAEILDEKTIMQKTREVEKRLVNGAKAELLELLRLKNIGRIRARRLFNKNIRTIRDVRRVDIRMLANLLGENIAKNIKEQLGIKPEDELLVRKKGQRTLN